MNRRVEPEWLDQLPPDDGGALGSRRDLQRLNVWMRNADLMAGALEAAFLRQAPVRLAELGAGDGTFLHQVARKLRAVWPDVSAVLVDRENVPPPAGQAHLDGTSWHAEAVRADAVDWLRDSNGKPFDAILANLFLHHLAETQLAELLRAAARRTRVFVAVEPRRSAWALCCSRLVGLAGCNRVTQHDAPVSVRAGFAGRELSLLWPAQDGWSLKEYDAGRFSHVFVAQKFDAFA